MLHRRHATHHAVGFLVGILIIGSALGGVTALLGRTTISDADAALRTEARPLVRMTDARKQRLLARSQKRRLRRTKRLQSGNRPVRDIGVTYPMQTASFAKSTDRTWDITYNMGFLSYPRLRIATPLGKPTITNWKNRNWFGLEKQLQKLMMAGAGMYPHSVPFGNYGKVIIAGHSSPPTMEALWRSNVYGQVFSKLPEARVGDRVEIRDESNKTHIYEVKSSKEVPATETSILLQDPSKKVLELFTCYPVGTTRSRWSVSLELVESAVAMK